MNWLNPKFWLSSVLWTVAVGAGCYWYGNTTGANSVLVNTLKASNEALNKRIADNKIEADRLNEQAKEASRDHAKELKDIKRTAAANAGKRVRIDPSICGSTGQAEGATSGGNGQGTSGAAFLPEQFTNELRQLGAKADEVTADMRTLVRRADEAGCFQ